MADNVIGIKFGVAGGASLSGESGKLIKSQLDSIASRIKLKVNINKTFFKSQLSSLKKELENTLGNLNIKIGANVKPVVKGSESSDEGEAKKQKATCESVRKTLEKLYQTKVKVLHLSETEQKGSVKGTLLNRQVRELNATYKEQLAQLKELLGVDDERVKSAQKLERELKKAYKAQQSSATAPQMANPTALAKLDVKAQSLYTDNGFDKIIARSKEAARIVDEFNIKVQAALNNPNDVTKESVANLNTEFLNTQARLKQIGRETNTVGNKIREAFDSRVIQRIAQVLLLTMLRALRQVYQNVKEINTAMTELKIVTTATAKQMEKAAKEIAASARNIGASIADLTRSTTVYARLGYDLADAQTLAEKTTIYARVSGVNVNEATTNITGIIKAFNIGADGLESVLDQMIWIGNNFPISQAEIGEAMNNAASSLVANGNTLQEAIAIVTAANTTIQNVSKSSTAVRTIAARISRSSAELEALGEDAGSVMSTSRLNDRMSAFGVAIVDANGELRSTYDILADVAAVWGDINSVDRAAIADMLAGTRQQSAFYSIVQNWGDAQKIVADSGNAAGALMEAQETRLDSIEGKLEQLKATWESFSQSILDSDLVKFFIDLLKGIGKVLNGIVSLGDGAVPKIALITIAVVGLMSLVKKFSPSIIKLVKDLKTLITTSGALAAALKTQLKNIGAALKKFLAENAPMLIISTLISMMTLFEGKAQGFTELIVGAVMLIAAGITIAVKGIDATIKGFMASNPIGWILAAITAVVAVIKGIIDLVKSFNPSYEDLKEAAKESVDAWNEVEEELENVRAKIEEVENELERLRAIETPTLTDQKDIERLEQQLSILKEEEKLKKDAAGIAQRDAINATESALDKLAKKNKDAIKNIRSDPGGAVSVLSEYSELLSEFEYGTNEKLDSYFNEYYKLLDQYTITTDGAVSAWSSILSRIKYKDAVESLKDFANTFKDTSNITGESLRVLAEQNGDVRELFAYLQTVGMWDGRSWDDLTGLIGNLRTKLTELAEVNIIDDIEALTDKFDSLSDALSDVAKNGIVSLGTLQTLVEKYPSLLNKYFNKTLDGYKLSDSYKDKTNYQILEDMAVTSLTEYQEALAEAKEMLSELTQEDDDYETALKNLATAQDNLNIKELEWASILRESSVEDETDRLEKMQDTLEDQLNVYKELIDIRKDLLKTYEEELSYQKELAKKQKAVADLQTQLSLAKLDKSAAGQARARELESQLQDAQDALDEYTLEKAVNDITSALDNEYGEYEAFIKEQVDYIGEQIAGIASTLDGILSGVEGLTNTQFSGKEMYDLYTDIKTKQTSGMSISGDTQEFMDRVSRGDYSGADQYYVAAKNAADSYETPSAPAPEKSADELKAEKMTKLKGAWGSGIKKNNKGDNGEVVYNGKKYYIESGGDDISLQKAAQTINGYGDRDIFHYGEDLYGCLDGSIVKLQQRANSYKADSSEGYVALKKAVEAAGIYHSGGFVGDIANLKSNEEFAKLLNGELVSTPKQMDSFMKKTLPKMLNHNCTGATINNNSPLIEIKCGDIEKDTLPKLKTLVDQAVAMVGKNMESALSRTGYRKQY